MKFNFKRFRRSVREQDCYCELGSIWSYLLMDKESFLDNEFTKTIKLHYEGIVIKDFTSNKQPISFKEVTIKNDPKKQRVVLRLGRWEWDSVYINVKYVDFIKDYPYLRTLRIMKEIQND